MLDKIEIFGMANNMAVHAAKRQNVVAQNIANADTPGFRALDVNSFADSYRQDNDGLQMRVTRPQHALTDQGRSPDINTFAVSGPTSPNGNSVSLETEMVKAIEVRQQYDVAMSVYSTSLNILRTSLGRGR